MNTVSLAESISEGGRIRTNWQNVGLSQMTSTQSHKLRVALLGFGAAAADHVVGWHLAGARIVAVADPNPQLRGMIRHISGAKNFPTVEHLMARPEYDVVDICTPHHLHWVQVSMLRYWPGALLVEKPVVTNSVHLDGLRKLLDCRVAPFVMRTSKRFEPHVEQLRATIGRCPPRTPIRLSVVWRQRPQYMADRLWYRRREVSGGGVVAGMGIHYFDLLLEYFGHVQIDRVVLLTSRKHPNAPDTTSENYARFSLSCARIHHVDLRLSCWKDYERLPSEVLVGQIGDTPFRFQRPLNFDHGSVLGREFSHYAEAIRQGASHPTKGTMLKAHSLVLEAYELGKGSKHTAKTP